VSEDAEMKIFDKAIRIAIEKKIQERARAIAEEMIHEYAQRLRKEYAEIACSSSLTLQKFVSVFSDGRELRITIQNDLIKELDK
jgi:predicted hydrocarbon binding protein